MALRKEGPAPTLAEHRVELEAKEYEDRRICMHLRGQTCAVRSVGSLLSAIATHTPARTLDQDLLAIAWASKPQRL